MYANLATFLSLILRFLHEADGRHFACDGRQLTFDVEDVIFYWKLRSHLRFEEDIDPPLPLPNEKTRWRFVDRRWPAVWMQVYFQGI